MDDFAPPSFSLGLDFEFEPQFTVREDTSTSNQAPESSKAASLRTFEDDDFETPITIGRDLEDPDPPRLLKRLRRGPVKEDASASSLVSASASKRELPEFFCGFDDEIEEFSSQEDRLIEELPSTLHHSVCGSSKFRLHGHGILTTQSTQKKKENISAPESANLETSSNKLTFPKLTTSPLRRFQLIDSDSDSDDPSISEGANRDANKSVSSLKRVQSNPSHHASVIDQRVTNASASVCQTDDLWEDFFPEKNFHIPTPALDEVCEEYFGSMKCMKLVQNNTKSCKESSNFNKTLEQQIDLGDPIPPAHRYFFHDDPRIQELVRSRLPNFFPLGAVNNTEYRQPTSTSAIDYMGQFNHGEGSKQTAGKSKVVTSSSRSKNYSKISNTEEVSLGWVNPKRGAAKANPKDAGKRRVQADGQPASHWFMGPNGKRVYVNKSGQELTGQMAYRQYKKESGGYKRPKKKKAGRKKK